MTSLRIMVGCALAAAFAVLLVQKSAISKLRQENETLRSLPEEAARLAGENEQIPNLRAGSEAMDSLRAANQDLPKLRNEVRQLREQKLEVEKLRSENQRLASAVKSVSNKPGRLSELEGYVPGETWTKAGFSTPEAAAQTWFWAMRGGDLRQVAECLSPEYRKEFEKDSEDKSELDLFRRVKGFRISEKKILADDKVVLGIQVATDGEMLKLPLRRFGNEWKLEEAP